MTPLKYSIRDLERLSGIKTHTIRMWEKRYGVITPERTDTNIRLYSDVDLQKLLNISILNRHGHKISHISEMSDDQLVNTVEGLAESNNLVDSDINNMVLAAIDLQEDQFERVLNSCLLKFGFEYTFCEVIFPLFEKLGIMWQIGRINACQERFITNLVRQKLLVAIDGLVGVTVEPKGTFLLFMPSGHEHEIGLLFANYLIRKSGYQVIYLGPSVPLEHLQRFGSGDKFEEIFVATNLPIPEIELESYLKELSNLFGDKPIHIMIPEAGEFPQNASNYSIYNDFESFRDKIV